MSPDNPLLGLDEEVARRARFAEIIKEIDERISFYAGIKFSITIKAHPDKLLYPLNHLTPAEVSEIEERFTTLAAMVEAFSQTPRAFIASRGKNSRSDEEGSGVSVDFKTKSPEFAGCKLCFSGWCSVSIAGNPQAGLSVFLANWGKGNQGQPVVGMRLFANKLKTESSLLVSCHRGKLRGKINCGQEPVLTYADLRQVVVCFVRPLAERISPANTSPRST